MATKGKKPEPEPRDLDRFITRQSDMVILKLPPGLQKRVNAKKVVQRNLVKDMTKKKD